MVTAIAVAGLLVAFLAPLWPAASRTTTSAGSQSSAWQIASSQAEVSLAQGYAAMGNRSGQVVQTTITRGIEREITYFYEVTVTPVPPDMKTVLVRVFWDDLRHQREVKLETVLTDPN